MKKLNDDHLALMTATSNTITKLRGLESKLKAARHLNPDFLVLGEAAIAIANCLDTLRIGMKNRTGSDRGSTGNLPCWSGALRPPIRAVQGPNVVRIGATLDAMLARKRATL